MTDLRPLGDRAFLARFPDEDTAAAWAEAVRRRQFPGVTDVVLAYDSAAVHADPDQVDPAQLECELHAVTIDPTATPPGRTIAIPVLYDGPDLDDVATACGLTVDQVVSLHSGPIYRVFALGFLPGFPYAGYLPEALAGRPRRENPRPRVPAGSVAIVGRQTAVYPRESPGGWHLLGRTPLRIVDLASAHLPIRAGDTLRFEPIDRDTFEARRGELL